MRSLAIAATVLFVSPAGLAGVIHIANREPLVGVLEHRPSGASLRIRTVDGVREIAREDVLRIETDEDLRRSLQRSIDKMDDNDPGAALRSSQWALRKGLFEEALALADRARPGDSGALDLAQYLPLPVLGVAADSEISAKDAWRLLNAGADPEHPVTGAVAIARLSALAVAQDVDQALDKALGMKDPALRSAALHVIHAATPAKLWSEAMRLTLFDPDAEVRGVAAQAAAAYDDPRMILAFQRALTEGNPPIREAAMDAIETLEEERALGALVLLLRRRAENGPARSYVQQGEQQTFVSDFDVDVANSAFIANPNIGVLQTGGVLDTALLATSARRFPVQHHQRAAAILSRLTRQDFGTDPDAWQAWLEARDSDQR